MLLTILPIALAAGAALAAAWDALIKVRARVDLSKNITADDANRIRDYLDKPERDITDRDVEDAAAVIRQRLGQIGRRVISNREKKALEEALRQQSVTGRARYMLGVADRLRAEEGAVRPEHG